MSMRKETKTIVIFIAVVVACIIADLILNPPLPPQ